MKRIKDQVVVFGAGAAGLAAALGAARAGAHVMLLETSQRLGGTVSHALIHTLGGLFDASGEILNTGLPEELLQRLLRADPQTGKRRIGRVWVLDTEPSTYEGVVNKWISSHSNIQPLLNGELQALHFNGTGIDRLQWRVDNQTWDIHSRAVIDATGCAAVIHRLGKDYLRASEPRAACGLVFRLRGLPPNSFAFPKNLSVLQMIKKAVEQGELPPECKQVWMDKGIFQDEVYCKWTLPPLSESNAALHNRDLVDRGVRLQSQLLQFLKQQNQSFSQARQVQTGSLGIRDAGAVIGEYTLTGQDVRSGRTFPDSIGRCSWPIEYWDPEQGICLEYLPGSQAYEIPLRCLKVRGLTNVWAAGKCFSAEPVARASARVVGTCWAMGQAAGEAAVGRLMDGKGFSAQSSGV